VITSLPTQFSHMQSRVCDVTSDVGYTIPHRNRTVRKHEQSATVSFRRRHLSDHIAHSSRTVSSAFCRVKAIRSVHFTNIDSDSVSKVAQEITRIGRWSTVGMFCSVISPPSTLATNFYHAPMHVHLAWTRSTIFIRHEHRMSAIERLSPELTVLG
jgi:hypothetical protein